MSSEALQTPHFYVYFPYYILHIMIAHTSIDLSNSYFKPLYSYRAVITWVHIGFVNGGFEIFGVHISG